MSGLSYKKDGAKYYIPAVDMTAVYNEGFESGQNEGFESGRGVGLEEGNALCAGKHFVATVVGDGTRSLKFDVPFEPDTISIYGFEDRVDNSVAFYTADIRCTSYYGGLLGVYRLNELNSVTMIVIGSQSATLSDRCTMNTENGVTEIEIKNMIVLVNNEKYYGTFTAGKKYIVVAVKHAE